jgi:biopolymer transport protein TolR
MHLLGYSAPRPQPVMNVTPLVDVVLVLLIIFMVVIPATESAGHIDLPGMLHVDEDPKSKTDPWTLTLSSDGRMFFEQEELTPERFRARMSDALVQDAARRLILRADRNAPYREVRKLFAACQELGFPGISLRVNELQGAGHVRRGTAVRPATK